MAMQVSTRRWQDRLIFLIGLWLFVSPMVFGYPSESATAINAYTAGLIMAILAAFDLYKTHVWAVVLNILVGVWTAASPWIVGTDNRSMTISLLASGITTIVLGLWEMRSDPELHRQWTKSGAAG
jgi:hypothetical protein